MMIILRRKGCPITFGQFVQFSAGRCAGVGFVNSSEGGLMRTGRSRMLFFAEWVRRFSPTPAVLRLSSPHRPSRALPPCRTGEGGARSKRSAISPPFTGGEKYTFHVAERQKGHATTLLPIKQLQRPCRHSLNTQGQCRNRLRRKER